MKKLVSSISLVFILFALTTVSCKKDKDKTPEELLIGYWDVTSLRTVEYTNGVKTDDVSINLSTGDIAVEFLANGTVTIIEDGTPGDPSDWDMDGDVLTIDGDEVDYTVSETTLTFSMEIEFEDGESYRYVYTITATRSS
jgi:hypothetical protein